MRKLNRHAACLMAALALTLAGAHGASAGGVSVRNEMDQDIKVLLCVDDNGEVREAADGLGAGAVIVLSPERLSDDNCDRLAVRLADGATWQYYQKPSAGAADIIIFSMEKANSNDEWSYPSVALDVGNYTHVAPAGAPFDRLLQAMQVGLDKEDWAKLAAPGFEAYDRPGGFVVSLAGVSWSLSGNGIVFAELVPGMLLAESISVSAVVSNATIALIFDELKRADATPVLVSFANEEGALNEEGMKMSPEASRIGDLSTKDEYWAAVDIAMEVAAASKEEGRLRLTFSSQDLRVDLEFDREDGSAVLTVSRKPDGAFG
jgi:hypothetical protein